MADGTRLERWVALQQKTWDCDKGAKAAKISVERGADEVVQSFSADVEELGRVLEDCLSMQAEELPSGSHQFRLVAYDHSGKQLAELPQTVKGKSRDATSAGQQAIATQRANHMAVDTMAFTLDKIRAELEQFSNRNGDLHDDVTALIGTVNELRLTNEDMLLKRLEFEERLKHREKLYEALEGAISQLLVPIGTLVIEKYGPGLLGGDKGTLQKVAAALDAPKEKDANVGPAPTAEESTNPVVPVVPESRQGALSQHTQGRGTGNRRPVPRKRGSKTPPPKTTKRK